MSEGEARVMTRQFLYVDGVEIEVCANENGKHFVKAMRLLVDNAQTEKSCSRAFNIIINLQNGRLSTIRWSGYRFRLETILFSEDDVLRAYCYHWLCSKTL